MGLMDESYKTGSSATFWRITSTTTKGAANASMLHSSAPDEKMDS